MRIHIIALGDSLEAITMRAVLEAQAHRVGLSFAATPEQFFAACTQSAEGADALIISAHGDEAGFVFPPLAEEVSEFVLDNDILTPKQMAAQMTQAPPLVFSTACFTGQRKMADIFLSAGAREFVGPTHEPEGADIALIVGLVFRPQSASLPIKDQLEKIATLVPDAAMFKSFESHQ
jgi:hypothetical protein